MKELLSFNIGPKKEANIKKQELKYNRGGHLKKGIKPITACIGTPVEFKLYPSGEREIESNYGRISNLVSLSRSKENHVHNINYYGNPHILRFTGSKNAGRKTYVISNIDSSNKLSKTYRNCTGLIGVGYDINAKKNISFMSHEDPIFFLSNDNNKNIFTNDLRQQLKKLQERSDDKTIDTAIFGGNYFKHDKKFTKNYIESIRLLSNVVEQVLDFEPLVIMGPKVGIHGEEDDVFFDNGQRNVFIKRGNIYRSSDESFYPSELESRMKEWDKEL